MSDSKAAAQGFLPPVPPESDPNESPKQLESLRQPPDLTPKAARTDASLSSDDWNRVYEGYAHTGSAHVLSAECGLRVEQVEHLLKQGIRRLGLPGIESFAVDRAEIANRLGKYALTPGDDAAIDPQKRSQQLMTRQSITSRVTREAQAAQVLLEASYSLTGTMLTLLHQVRGRIDEGKIVIPDEISGSYLKILCDSIEKMARAVDISTRLSRLTAGEPESNFGATIAHLVQQLSPAEVRTLAETGQAPAVLRGRDSESEPIDVCFSVKDRDD